MKVGIILSGCGVFDGSEIYETTLTLLALESRGIEYQAFAPDRTMYHVINHANQKQQVEARNILVESARLMRGNILPITEADPDALDAVIFPGGFGAAKNLCTYAIEGEHYFVYRDIKYFAERMIKRRKPMGFMCIAPMMVPLLYPGGVKMSIGIDPQLAKIAEQKGAQHIDCAFDQTVVDEHFKVVCTPAFMIAENLLEAKKGIELLIDDIVRLCGKP